MAPYAGAGGGHACPGRPRVRGAKRGRVARSAPHLLSLFDGTGTARVALDQALRALGRPGGPATSWFAEHDDELAGRVEALWTRKAEREGVAPHRRIARDVWELLNSPAKLWEVCRAVEPEGMLLIIGGSPCQQITPMGASEGRLGVCGVDSNNFFVFPLVARAVTCLRPDLHVHVLVENSGSARTEHKHAMLESLGLDAKQAITLDAGAWSAFRRPRMFMSSFEVGPPAALRPGGTAPGTKGGSGWRAKSTAPCLS